MFNVKPDEGIVRANRNIGLTCLYGAGANNISEQITKETGTFFSKSEAQEVIDDYFAAFPRLKAWIDDNKEFIKDNGFTYSFFGRKRRLANVASEDKATVAHTIRSGLNFLVQSISSDINLLGAIDAQKMLKAKGLKALIFALVHDSILAEVPDDEIEEYSAIIKSCVQTDRGLNIPGCPIGCEFEVGDDYSFGKFEEKYGEMGAV